MINKHSCYNLLSVMTFSNLFFFFTSFHSCSKHFEMHIRNIDSSSIFEQTELFFKIFLHTFGLIKKVIFQTLIKCLIKKARLINFRFFHHQYRENQRHKSTQKVIFCGHLHGSVLNKSWLFCVAASGGRARVNFRRIKFIFCYRVCLQKEEEKKKSQCEVAPAKSFAASVVNGPTRVSFFSRLFCARNNLFTASSCFHRATREPSCVTFLVAASFSTHRRFVALIENSLALLLIAGRSL